MLRLKPRSPWLGNLDVTFVFWIPQRNAATLG